MFALLLGRNRMLPKNVLDKATDAGHKCLEAHSNGKPYCPDFWMAGVEWLWDYLTSQSKADVCCEVLDIKPTVIDMDNGHFEGGFPRRPYTDEIED